MPINNAHQAAIRAAASFHIRTGRTALEAARRAAEVAEDHGLDYYRALEVALPHANAIRRHRV